MYLTLAPGVTDVNNTGNPNIHGARDTDVVTLVDGVSTTDPFTGQFGQQLNVESIEEIEVITSGASAEYSRAQGGFVSIITKSGSNEFKGSFSFSMRTNKLDGDGAGIDSVDVRGGLGESDGFRNLSFTDFYPFLSLSGAFIKDHLWYYFAPEYSQVEVPVNAGTQAYVQGTTSARITGKVSWEVASNNHMTFTGIYDNTETDNLGLTSLTDKNTAFTFTRGGPTFTVQDNAIISPTLSLESTISRFDQTFTQAPATNPDTNGNGILTTDNRLDLGGNANGFINLRERDPGEDYDSDGKFDVFEDTNHDRVLDGCQNDPVTGQRLCFPPTGQLAPWQDKHCLQCKNGELPNPVSGLCDDRSAYTVYVVPYNTTKCPGSTEDAPIPPQQYAETYHGEDTDLDSRLTQRFGCEGSNREDINCDGALSAEIDLNNNGQVDCPKKPDGTYNYNDPTCEDKGIPCVNPALCPGNIEPGTRGNGQLDSEDRNGNRLLDDTPFPGWVDRNHNSVPDHGEFTSPTQPDEQYVRNLDTNRIAGPSPFTSTDSRTRDSLKEDLSYYIDDLFGSHDIKAGMAWEREGYDASFTQRPIWQLRPGAIDQTTGQIGGTIGAFLPTQQDAVNSASSDNVGFYLQDNFKPLPNLTLGLGVRFDRESVSSHGYEYFDPVQQRREYDNLQNLRGLEGGADQNHDGVVTQSLIGDPLYNPSPSIIVDPDLDGRVAQVDSDLAEASVTRFTRHNFLTSIESTFLGGQGINDPNMLANGRPRQPQDFTITNNNLAPRLSVSWDPWADGKSKATASWGRFYDKLFLATVINEEGPDFLTPYYGFDSDGVDLAGLPDNHVGRVISQAPPTAFQIDRSLRTPFTDEMTLGFQREIAPEVSVSITYIQRKFRDQLQDVDVNHSVRRAPFCNGPTTPSGYCDDFGISVVRPDNGGGGEAGKKGPDDRLPDGYPDLYINNLNFNQILRVGNYNYQAYKGYELQITRRLSRKWQMNANYAWSKSTGQAEAFGSESGNDPSLTELKQGYLAFDQTNVAKFFATAFLPGDWQFGGGITWASGLPYSMVNRFQSGDNVNFAQTRRLYGYKDINNGYFIEENRNIHRNESVYEIDVRTEKKFVIGQITAGAFFEIFNLLNSDSLRVNEIDNGFHSLQANETRDFGRRFQFGIHMDF